MPTECFFLIAKVAFTKDIYILNMAKVFEIWFFCNIEIREIPKTVKNVPKKFKHNI